MTLICDSAALSMASARSLLQAAKYGWDRTTRTRSFGCSVTSAVRDRGDATLTVTYDSIPGQDAGRSVRPCDTACSDPGLMTNSTTPTLTAATSDADGGTLTHDFEVYAGSSNTPSSLVVSGSATAASGAEASWTVPSGHLVNGSTYEYRVRAFDGIAYGAWSNGYASWTVDTTPPAAPTVTSSAFSMSGWAPGGTSGTISFSDSSTDVATYAYDVDGSGWTSQNASSTSATLGPAVGEHIIAIQATDAAGNATAASYSFGVGGQITAPTEDATTQGSIGLDSVTAPTTPNVVYLWRPGASGLFATVPTSLLSYQSGSSQPAWPLTATVSASSATAPAMTLDALDLTGYPGPIQLEECSSTDNAGDNTVCSQPIDVTVTLPSNGLPGPPQLETLPTDGGIDMKWSSPVVDGTSVTSFAYTVTDANGNIVSSGSVGGSSASLQVNGLTDGEGYQVSLTATDAAGTGAAATDTATPSAVYVLPASALSVQQGDVDSSNDVTSVTTGSTLIGTAGASDFNSFLHVNLSSLPTGATLTGLQVHLGTPSCLSACTGATGTYSAYDLVDPVTTSSEGAEALQAEASDASSTTLSSDPDTLNLERLAGTWDAANGSSIDIGLDIGDASASEWSIPVAGISVNAQYLLPAAPASATALTAAAADGGSLVTWVAPAELNAADANATYEVEVSNGAGYDQTYQTENTEYNLTGLVDTQTYTVSVTATTPYGTSSAVITTVTPAAVSNSAQMLQAVNDYDAALDGLYNGTYASVSTADSAFSDSGLFSTLLGQTGANALTYRNTATSDANINLQVTGYISALGTPIVVANGASGGPSVEGFLTSTEMDEDSSGNVTTTNPNAGDLWSYDFTTANESMAMLSAEDMTDSADPSSGESVDSSAYAYEDASGVADEGSTPTSGSENPHALVGGNSTGVGAFDANARIPVGGVSCDTCGTYDRTNAALWAHDNTYAPQFFGDDCTDFASHVLAAGGYPFVGDANNFNVTNNRYWYFYTKGAIRGAYTTNTYSWSLARDLYSHMVDYENAYVVHSPSQLEAGDLVFYQTPGMAIGHVAVVQIAGSNAGLITLDEHSREIHQSLFQINFIEAHLHGGHNHPAFPIYVHVDGTYVR
jgi:hypothetical protein